jgi:hypothetical protein
MLCRDVPRAPPCAALLHKTAAPRRGGVPSLPAARKTAPLRRSHARRARAELQRGGGADEASAPLTKANLKEALSAALHELLGSLRADVGSLRTDMILLRADVGSMRADTTSLLSVASATCDNLGALAEALAGGGGRASRRSRARVCSLSELGAAVLAHESGDDESRAVLRQLCAWLAPDVRAAPSGCFPHARLALTGIAPPHLNPLMQV